MTLSQFAHTAAHMSEDHMRNNLLTIADKLIALAATPQQALPLAPSETSALPFAILDDEMAALRRFYETTEDGQDYDVPVSKMKKLATIGLVRRVTGNRYEFTDFGLSVINGDFATPPQATLPASEAVTDSQIKALLEHADYGVYDGQYRFDDDDLMALLRSVAALYTRTQPQADTDKADAARWSKCKTMRKEWWIAAMDNASRPHQYGGQSLDAAIDAVIAAQAPGARGGSND
ncbi:hypothetical protein A9977_14495 [Variovorax sp. UMC13]|nr:hypothetical protein [Variovorax sp. UMC13]